MLYWKPSCINSCLLGIRITFIGMLASLTTGALDCSCEIAFFKASKSMFVRGVFLSEGMSFILAHTDWHIKLILYKADWNIEP